MNRKTRRGEESATNISEEVEATFVIADLSGFTALTETHGDLHAVNVVSRYVEMVGHSLHRGARLVERVGDEVLIVADEIAAAIRTAMRLAETVAREPLFPLIRVGAHAGSVVFHDGHYFGTALNLTARVAAHARAGQILCTEGVAACVRGLEDVVLRALGPVRFRNITDPVAIFEVIADPQGAEDKVVDPVCRMQVARETAPARLPFRDQTYHFCSFACARMFAENPERYAGS